MQWIKDRLKPAPREPDPPGVTISQRQVDAAHFASNVAMCVLVYFLWIYTLSIAKDRAEALHLTQAGSWHGDLQFWFPYIIGFAGIAYGIPYVAKNSIPTFMALDWKTGFWPKLWSLGIALFVSAVIVAGTFTVQGDAILEKDRDSAVKVAQVEQSSAVLAGRIASKESELRSMMENRNAYLAQAASVGAIEWQASYIDKTDRGDPQRDRIVRALGAARAADNVRAELASLRERAATQTTTQAVAGRVSTASTSWIASALGWVEGVRAILLSLVMDVVCLMMPWIARHLELRRNAQLANANPQPMSDAYQIADHSAEAPLAVDPAGPRMNKVVDATTGEELVHVKGHMRVKRPKKNGRTEATLETTPPAMPVFDTPATFGSDPRVARAAANEADERSGEVQAVVEMGDEQPADRSRDQSSIHSDMGGAAAPAELRDLPEREAMAADQQAPESEALNGPPDTVQVADVGGTQAADEGVGLADLPDGGGLADTGDLAVRSEVETQPVHEELTPEELAAKIDAGEIAELTDEPGVFVEVIPADSYESFANRRGLPAPAEKEVA